MKVLLTGGSGQLGRALLASFDPSIDFSAPGRDQLDLADQASIERTIRLVSPNVVINAGAYTAVDKAESERELAFAINATAPAILAKCCAELGARLISISTDFVFDGAQGFPYVTDAMPNPQNVYGASKLQGEQQIAGTPRLVWHVVRTAWVYSADGQNFVRTMLRLFRERAAVNVVCDQVGTPTSAASLARCVRRVLLDEGPSGVFHYTDAGVASWYDFAVAIQEEAIKLGLIHNAVPVKPIPTREYPTPARRPSYSVLEKSSTFERLQLEPPHWRVELRNVLQEIKA